MEQKRIKGERPIEIGGEYWGWKVGRSNVVIFSPDREKTVVPLSDVVIVDANGVSLKITPGEIGRYIRNNLRKSHV